MNFGGEVTALLNLPRAEVPFEIHRNFIGLRHVPLFFAAYVMKLSHNGKPQRRVLIATLDNLYVCHPNGDILRCVPYEFMTTVFHDPKRHEVGIVVPKEYDLLISTTESNDLVQVIETLRGLRTTDEPLNVEVVERQKSQKASPPSHHELRTSMDTSTKFTPMLAASSTPGESPERTDNDLTASMCSVTMAPVSTNAPQRWYERISAYLSSKKRMKRKLISGWNDHMDLKDPDNATLGYPGDVCIGNGIYALRLERTPGFYVSLYDKSLEPDDPQDNRGKAEAKEDKKRKKED